MSPANASVQAILQSGFEHHQVGDLKAAERSYRRVLKRDNSNPDALYLLGTLHYQNGDLKRAEKALRLALDKRPNHPETLYNLARVLMDAEDLLEAEGLLQAALSGQPENVSVLRNLGVVYLRLHQPGTARDVLQRALALQANADTLCDLGLAYSQTGADQDSEQAFENALKLDAHHARARHNLSHLKLRQSRFADGWPDYEARKLDPQAQFQARAFDLPTWQGEDLTDKTILVCCEQGLGDQILHASMFQDLTDRARQVVIECEPRLVDLFARSFSGARVVPLSDPPHPDIEVSRPDYQIDSGSLGPWLRESTTAFSKNVSYLMSDTERLQDHPDERKPRIGISWKSARAAFGAPKSTTLSTDWRPIFVSLPDASYQSVQYGSVATDVQAVREGLGVEVSHDHGFDITQDIDGLARLLTSLDLVITTSNTTAHLAGALGVPVWCLVPRGPGRLWYWFDGEDSSLWYPSMRLYWQKIPGVWSDVFDQVASDLQSHI